MIIAAGWIKEPKAWRTKILDQYKSLQAADFEDRKVSIIYPNNFKWRSLGQELVEATNSHILSIKELGQIIIVPSESTLPDGVVTATFSLCIEQINEIIASSSYLKFNQTKKKFGPSVLEVIGDRPLLESTLLDAPVSWFLIQKYYSRAADGFREDIFEPYIHFEDMVWHNVEDILADLVPSFEFWKNTTYLGYQHQSKLVSLNLIDNAINLCNNLHLNYRLDNHFRKSLWHELQTRYMKHEPIEQSILAELQPSLAMEVATI
jgi:hypothetical protein